MMGTYYISAQFQFILNMEFGPQHHPRFRFWPTLNLSLTPDLYKQLSSIFGMLMQAVHANTLRKCKVCVAVTIYVFIHVIELDDKYNLP